MVSDSHDLQQLILKFFPEITIDDVAKESGQRVVYFCSLKGSPTSFKPIGGAEIQHFVLKAILGADPTTIAYMQMEIEVLNSIQSFSYPKLYYHELFVEDPETEEKLNQRLFVTIEEKICSSPLSTLKQEYDNEEKVANLLFKLVNALELLWNHPRKLVHRDIKPDNILIRPSGDVVIIDLGILRETGATGLTATHLPFGPLSCPYSSPEQARNQKRDISFKTDIFALGTIAYELIIGGNPYFTDTNMPYYEILNNVVNLVPPRLDKIGKTSEGFALLIEKMMQKEPYKRHRKIESLKADLLRLERKQDDN